MQLKRFFQGGMILFFIMAVFTGCTKQSSNQVAGKQRQSKPKKELVMAIGSEPEGGFDPITGWGRYGNPLFQSTLVDTDVNMKIIKDLASDYQVSQDGFTWTFTLRNDAYFTDGQKVTSEDVVFTFEEAKKSGSIVDLTNMKNVSMVNENTVKFTLVKPDSSFIYTVAATGIVPKHAYGQDYGETPIGSGPFKLMQWDKGQQIIMEANEDYYGKVPEIKKITILFMEEDAALAAAQAGQLDVAMTSASLANQQIEGMHLEVVKTIDNRGLTLPYLPDEGRKTKDGYKIGNDVTSDIAIRRALSYGIDRKVLVDSALNGYGRSAYSEADGMPWGNDQAMVEYDIKKAEEILKKAGWIDQDHDGIREKNGKKAEFCLLYSAGDSIRQALANAVSLQAEKLGIKINVEGTSWDVIDQRMYSEGVLMGWGAQSPIETYLLYHSDNMGRDYYNPEYFSNKKVDQYINQAMSAMDLEKSMEYWKKVQWDGKTGVATQGECPWIWLVNVDHLYYIRDGLDIGTQKIHPHGHAWPLLSNLKDWRWK
ncbi:ABC transporter substrate-binding protein [Garciella nitratireducens]|uniref:ABC transporter substrate-binding protein n=1 Tax=Garciella nitratireducens TaxID=218205 RepID=UPI000DEB37ED|nr:ABC transporter substrate-binding protein [Garciella nitratireducens]RBP44159.1 peptide/nickel transport system substrate-binding protein [Garciella nitratireducens]